MSEPLNCQTCPYVSPTGLSCRRFPPTVVAGGQGWPEAKAPCGEHPDWPRGPAEILPLPCPDCGAPVRQGHAADCPNMARRVAALAPSTASRSPSPKRGGMGRG